MSHVEILILSVKLTFVQFSGSTKTYKNPVFQVGGLVQRVRHQFEELQRRPFGESGE